MNKEPSVFVIYERDKDNRAFGDPIGVCVDDANGLPDIPRLGGR